jgi:class 3 adenylate cyclase/tetratricopeptide (TPR) repeat protein
VIAAPLDVWRRQSLIVGETGSGKTVTALTLAAEALRGGWDVYWIDGKADPATATSFLTLAEVAGIDARDGTRHPLDGWRGDPEAIINRLLATQAFTEPYYEGVARTVLRVAVGNQPPRTFAELVGRLDKRTLQRTGRDDPAVVEAIRSLPDKDVAGARARYDGIAWAVGTTLDGTWSYEDTRAAYVPVGRPENRHQAAEVGAFLLEDILHWALARKRRDRPALVIVDEFSKLSDRPRSELCHPLQQRAQSCRVPEVWRVPEAGADMFCGKCRHENRAGASFCGGCGAPLARAPCPSCGAGIGPGDRFCDDCGTALVVGGGDDPRSYTPAHLAEKILSGRSAIEGEHRTVTVMFADTVGSTSLGEQLDAELFYAVASGCVDRMMEAVHRYEGTVTQVLGDGIMALFGAPIAHEDSARRGVSAGLDMQASLARYAAEVKAQHGIEYRFRVGLHTGPVVVGTVGNDLRMDYTALGDTANLASRMESAAEPGTVYLTESTHRWVRDHFECEALGALAVKGKAEPVVTYRAVRERAMRSRVEIASERGLTPLVGRAGELSALRSFLDDARRGNGRVVFASGEAGIGKSRLLLEFRRSLDEDVSWLEGHCIAYGAGFPYLPITDLVRRAFGVQEDDDEVAVLDRIERRSASWREPSRATLGFLRYLLSVAPGDESIFGMDARERRAGILDGLRALLGEHSRTSPLVVVVEDLQWIDETSQELLASIVDTVASAGILLVLTHRSGYVAPFGDRTFYGRIGLRALEAAESVTMAEAVLASAVLQPEIAALIVRKAEGNPFFVEEVIKSLLESGDLQQVGEAYVIKGGLEQLEVPDTIQEVILARIDRLQPEARHAIQLASVIGREFSVRLLDRISGLDQRLDPLLDELRTLELIRETSRFPEVAYMFKHALTHEVAYGSLLTERRRALHHLVAVAVEELYSDRRAEHYETLAHHYYEAQDWEPALRYLRAAADKAAAAYAAADALAFLARALTACDMLGDELTGATISDDQGQLCLATGDFDAGKAALARALEGARRTGDAHLEGQVLVHRGLLELWAHEFNRSEATLRQGLAHAEGRFDDVAFSAQVFLGMLLVLIGRLEEGEGLLTGAEALGGTIDDALGRATQGNILGYLSMWGGRYEEAAERFGSSLEDTTASQDVTTVNDRLFGVALTLAGRGQYQPALESLREILSICERTGEPLYPPRAMNTIGWIYGELGDHERAEEWNRRSVAAAIALGLPDQEIDSNARLNLADDLAGLGRFDEAEEQLRQVETVIRNPLEPQLWALWIYSPHFFHSDGELALRRGDSGRALSLARECIARAEATNRAKYIVKGRRLAGQALLAAGDLDGAEHEVDVALALAHEVGNPAQLWRTFTARAALRRAQGRMEEAEGDQARALEVATDVANSLTDEELRARCLSTSTSQP